MSASYEKCWKCGAMLQAMKNGDFCINPKCPTKRQMEDELQACGWKRRLDTELDGRYFWVSPRGRAKPNTDIAWGYLQTLKDKAGTK